MSPRQTDLQATLHCSGAWLCAGRGGEGHGGAGDGGKGSREMWHRVLETGKESSQRSQRGMGESTGSKRGK